MHINEYHICSWLIGSRRFFLMSILRRIIPKFVATLGGCLLLVLMCINDNGVDS
jgi:hypothetical protein